MTQFKSSFKPQASPVYSGSRIFGVVRGDTFHKTIQPHHFLRKPPAIASDVDALRSAERAGAIWAEITNAKTGEIYRARIATWWQRGTRFNRGHGEQIYLPMEQWTRPDLGQGEQLTLFERGVA